MKAKDNPFSVQRVLQIRYRFDEGGWDDLLRRLESLRFRAAIVGQHGSGKSTLLEDLRPRLAEQGFTCKPLLLNERTPRFERRFLNTFLAELASRDIILFDGAERMSWLRWRRFMAASRNVAGLIITTHHPGRLRTLITCHTTANLLHEIVRELVHGESGEWEEIADQLYKKHQGNLRDALREMYDWVATNELPRLRPTQ